MEQKLIIYWYLGEVGPEGAGLTALSAEEILSQSELRRYRQFRVDKRRREWLAGRFAAKLLLRGCVPELGGVPLQHLIIGNQPDGAPFLQIGAMPLNLQISISHREGAVAVAVSSTSELRLGIDLEWVEERDPSFYADYFTNAEKALMTNNPVERKAWIGTLIWSAKEAMLKALGVGLRVDTRTVEITAIGSSLLDEWGRFELNAPGFPGRSWQGYWRQAGNHICTLVVTGVTSTPVFQRFEMLHSGELIGDRQASNAQGLELV